MSGKKFRWWWFLIPVLAVAVVLTAVFWDTIMIYAVPKAVLSNALTNTLGQLDERFRYNPLRNIWDVYDSEGKYTAAMELDTTSDLLGDISYDMTVQTDISSNQVLAEGIIGSSGSDLALSMYLNRDFMAMSSAELLNGNYYGITYDTFSSDMNHFPLVKLLIPTATMQEWEDSVSEIQQLMNRSCQLLQITDEDIRMLMAGILLLDSNVSREAVVVNGERFDSYRINYAAAGKEVKEILGHVLDTSHADAAELTAAFYLWEDSVIRVDISGRAGENSVCYTLDLGNDALSGELVFTEERLENGKQSSLDIAVSTQLNGSSYGETVNFRRDKDGKSTSSTISYDWDTVTGDMTLSWNNTMPIRLNLTQNEDGICIVTEDFAQLMAITLQTDEGSSKDISCTMVLSRGSSIEMPAYKNLDAWSTDDLLTLLKGIGSLIGFNF